MAVGVDYSLFYLQREREERRARQVARTSRCCRTAATSGQAVLISGATVLIAMAGMLFAGNTIFTTMGVGDDDRRPLRAARLAERAPALLHKLGDRVDGARCRIVHRRRGQDRFWTAVVRRVLRRPVLSVVLSAALLVALALPALHAAHEAAELHRLAEGPADRADVRATSSARSPGSQTPVVARRQRRRRRRRRSTGRRIAAFRQRRARDGRDLPAVPRLRQPRQDGRARRVLARRQGRRQGVEPRAADAARTT